MRKASLIIVLTAFIAGFFLSVLIVRLDNISSRWSVTPSPDQGSSPDITAPQRVISLAPNITEWIFALGAGDLVAGVSSFCEYPPEAAAKPRVGGLVNPNTERLLYLEPDLIVLQEPNSAIEAFCRRHEIKFVVLRMLSLKDIYNGLDTLGKLLDRREAAAELIDSTQKNLALINNIERGQRPSVMVCIGRTPGSLKNIFTAGKDSFITELVEIAGAENIYGDMDRRYLNISKESIRRRDPDIIIDTFPGVDLTSQQLRHVISDWESMPGLTAVRNNRIHVLTSDYAHIPGPRIVKLAEDLARIFFPGEDLPKQSSED